MGSRSLVLATVIAVVASGCGAAGVEPTREVAVTRAVTDRWAEVAAPEPLDRTDFPAGVLAVGQHTSTIFGAPLTWRIDDEPWQMLTNERTHDLYLVDSAIPAGTLAIDERRQVSVFRPSLVHTQPYVTGPDLFADLAAVSVDVASPLLPMLFDNDAVDWGIPRDGSVGGRPATVVDAAVGKLPREAAETAVCSTIGVPCALLTSTPTGFFQLALPQRRLRVWVVEEGRGAPIVVVVEAPTDEFDDFLPRAERLLDGLTFLDG